MAVESDGTLREPVEIGRGDEIAAVRAEHVPVQRIEEDEYGSHTAEEPACAMASVPASRRLSMAAPMIGETKGIPFPAARGLHVAWRDAAERPRQRPSATD